MGHIQTYLSVAHKLGKKIKPYSGFLGFVLTLLSDLFSHSEFVYLVHNCPPKYLFGLLRFLNAVNRIIQLVLKVQVQIEDGGMRIC